jgi:hypothetical protein
MMATVRHVDFRFGTSKISGRLIFVEQRVRCLTARIPKQVLRSENYCFFLQFKVSFRFLKVIL